MKESKVKEDLEYLLECVKEIFTEMGENKLVQFISFLEGKSVPPEDLELERTVQLLSLYFQLLNMVEENSAAQNKSTDKAMAEGALSNLRTMFNNIKNKSTPVKSTTPEQENQEGGANDDIYYAKYLKYKKKYMELQSRSNI